MKVVDLINYLATFPGETDMKDVPDQKEGEEKKKKVKEEVKDSIGL